jgi:hypothetical protein
VALDELGVPELLEDVVKELQRDVLRLGDPLSRDQRVGSAAASSTMARIP